MTVAPGPDLGGATLPGPALGLLIGGELVDGGAEPICPVDPATGRPGEAHAAATAADVARACFAAEAAHRARNWAEMAPPARAAVLRRISELIMGNREALALTQMRQNGKGITECRAQATKAAEVFTYYAAVVETQEAELTPPRGDYLSMTVYEPYGVVALITPWNSPLTLDAQKLAPALAAGNAVVLKPSEVTPGVGLMLGKLCAAAGVPAGAINVVNGRGGEIGDALVGDPRVRMISFTGGTATGRRIAEAAGRRLVPVSLELGGKSPHIVFADADIDAAAQTVADGIFVSMGQSCVAGSRLLVERRVHAQVLERVAAHAARFRVGRPTEPETELGPMATFAQRDIVEAHVADTVAAGGRVVAGGARPEAPELADGAYYLPTVVDGVRPDFRLAQEEVFGPVLAVMAFEDEDELIAMANGTAFGLAAGVWTRDFPKAWRVARRLEAGTVWINSYKLLSISTPFGGVKDSGLAREKGPRGLRLYQEPKGIYVGLGG